MEEFDFLTKNEHFIEAEEVTNHPIYDGTFYRYLVNTTEEKLYIRYHIYISKEKNNISFLQQLGMVEDAQFVPLGLGMAANPDIKKTQVGSNNCTMKQERRLDTKSSDLGDRTKGKKMRVGSN